MEIYIDDFTNSTPTFELSNTYKYLNKIAQGSFGTVLHCFDNFNNQEVAIKVINKKGLHIELISRMKNEISILKQLQHENIVKFFGYKETNSYLYIITEFLKYGTLSQFLKSNKQNKISEKNISILISKLLNALNYLHNKQIVHRDIKPENIMFSKENDYESIKLIDFGLSAQNFDFILNNNEYCGTLLYMAPEQIEKKSYSKTVDIWSIGIIMYILLYGKHPFYIKGDQKENFIEKIKNKEFIKNNINNKGNRKISYMAKNLLNKLLEPNPSWRYTSDKAIKHPWITRNKNDEIPETFNEILNKKNNIHNLKFFFLFSIFLNYYKKKYIKNQDKKNINNYNSILNYKNKNKKKINIHKDKIFKINKKYIEKCNYYNDLKNKLLQNQKEKFFDNESENSNNNNNDEIIRKLSIKKHSSINSKKSDQSKKEKKIKNNKNKRLSNKENNLIIKRLNNNSIIFKNNNNINEKNINNNNIKSNNINEEMNLKSNKIYEKKEYDNINEKKNEYKSIKLIKNNLTSRNNNLNNNENKTHNSIKTKDNIINFKNKELFAYNILPKVNINNNENKIHKKKISSLYKKENDNFVSIIPIILPNILNNNNKYIDKNYNNYK